MLCRQPFAYHLLRVALVVTCTWIYFFILLGALPCPVLTSHRYSHFFSVPINSRADALAYFLSMSARPVGLGQFSIQVVQCSCAIVDSDDSDLLLRVHGLQLSALIPVYTCRDKLQPDHCKLLE